MSKENKLALSKVEGLIPELRFPEFQYGREWSISSLDEFLKIPVTYGIVKAGDFQNEGVKMVRGGDIKEGNVNEELPLVSNEIHKQYKRTILEQNDIVISLVGYPGQAAVIPDSLIGSNISRAVGLIRTNSKINTQYLTQYLNSEVGRKNVLKPSAGSAQTVVNLGAINNLLIPCTYPEEQHRIASCLSSLDEVITAHSQKLDLLKNHKKGLMQNLFPQEGETMPKYRFKEFEKDGEWVEEVLGGICDVRDGTHDSPKYVSKGYPMITSKNLLINGMIDFDNVSYLSEDDYNQINKRSKVDIDDILFGMIGTIGNPVIIKNDGFAIKNVALIKGIGKLNQEFLLHQLKSNYILTQFDKVNAGGILKFIALGVIRNLTVIVPSIKEQQKIASCLSSLDALITAQTEKIEQLKLHKKGLMQGLFPKIID